jgi:hypothetical protein
MTQEGVPASGREKSASGQPGSLICQLDKLITLAENRGGKAGRWASIWQRVDIVSGLMAAVLAAIAGAAALASVAGRIPAAILALSAAGLAAGNQFLGSGVRYERNRKRRNAWKALELDARLDKAKLEESPPRGLEEVMRALLDRRAAIEDMDHEPVPLIALGRQVRVSARSGHTSPKVAE